MRAQGLASAERAGRTLAYRANHKHPQSVLLGRLLKAGTAAPRTALPGKAAARVRGWLAASGAPLLVSQRVTGPMPKLEEVLALALTLSLAEPTVALVLPLVFWAHKDLLASS